MQGVVWAAYGRDDDCTVALWSITVGQSIVQKDKSFELELPHEGKGNGE